LGASDLVYDYKITVQGNDDNHRFWK